MYACVRFADILRYDLIDKIPFRFIYNMRTAPSEFLMSDSWVSPCWVASHSQPLLSCGELRFSSTPCPVTVAPFTSACSHQFSSRALGHLQNCTSSQGVTVSVALQKMLQCRWSFQCFLTRNIWMYKNCHEFIFPTWNNISHFFLSQNGFVVAR